MTATCWLCRRTTEEVFRDSNMEKRVSEALEKSKDNPDAVAWLGRAGSGVGAEYSWAISPTVKSIGIKPAKADADITICIVCEEIFHQHTI